MLLVDLNWAIFQRKASADIELSVGTEEKIRSELRDKLNWKGRREYQRLLEEFEAQGGDEDDFQDPIEWEAIGNRVDALVVELQSMDLSSRGKATAEAITIGVDPRLILSVSNTLITSTTGATRTRFPIWRNAPACCLQSIGKSKRRGRSMSFQSRSLNRGSRGGTRPVTDAGKAVASQNARKHGLNAPPDVAHVSQWFNVIVDNQENDFEEPNLTDPRHEAALRLAIAEA